MKMANNFAVYASYYLQEYGKRSVLMKKLVGITGLILIACVCIGAAAVPPAEMPEPEIRATEPAPSYVIRDSGGNIAVFLQGESAPVMVTQTRTDALPRQDSRRVKEGISVEGRQELEKLLEDYCS